MHGNEDDWRQEAAIALLEAAERFDVSRGFRFLTFATAHVRGRLSTVLRRDPGMIRVPTTWLEKPEYFAQARRLTVTRPISTLGADGKYYGDVAAPEPEEDDRPSVLPHFAAVPGARNREIALTYLQGGISLRAIGERYGLSPERVRQLVSNAICKVRKSYEKAHFPD